MNSHLLVLYRAPFRYDGIRYIWDADNNMVADFRGENNTICPRGWGRFQYMDYGAILHDEMEVFIRDICRMCLKNPWACVAALDAAWEVK